MASVYVRCVRASSRLNRRGAVTAACIAVAAVALTTAATAQEPSPGVVPPVNGVSTAVARFAGIPQHGAVLGRPGARVRVVVYVDLACPVCRDAAPTMVRRIIRRFVRSGRVTMELRPVAFVSTSSMSGSLATGAAAAQDAAWPFADVILANQGSESESEWLTAAMQEEIASRLGLDVGRWRSDVASAAVAEGHWRNERRAIADGVLGVPTFVLRGPRGRRAVVGLAGIRAFASAYAQVAPRPRRQPSASSRSRSFSTTLRRRAVAGTPSAFSMEAPVSFDRPIPFG